jgi:hypothetical protein
VPLNLRIRGRELPLGLGMITLMLFALAIVNLFTKKVATVWGSGFTICIFTVFVLTERYNRRKGGALRPDLEKFQLVTQEVLSQDSIGARPGNVLVSVRNPNELGHLKNVLDRIDERKLDIVAVTVKRISRQGSGGFELNVDQIFSDKVAELFSRTVSVAEKAGKHVELLVVPGRDYNRAVTEVAQRLQSSLVVMGLSARMTPSEQAKAFGDAWEKLPAPRPQLSLEIFDQRAGQRLFFNMGPHPPRLWPEDLDLLHRLWLKLSEKGPGHKLHHRDVVRVALRRLERDLQSSRAGEVLEEIKGEASEERRPPGELGPS